MKKSPERLMLEAIEYGQNLRANAALKNPLKSVAAAKAWQEWDALAAEAIARLAEMKVPLTDPAKEELRKIGNGLAVILGMNVDEEENERWYTRWGTKTGLGLVLILERFIHHVNGNFANADDETSSLAAEARSLEAKAQKQFAISRRKKAKIDSYERDK